MKKLIAVVILWAMLSGCLTLGSTVYNVIATTVLLTYDLIPDSTIGEVPENIEGEE